MKKQIMAVVCAFCLLAGMMPATANAQENAKKENFSYVALGDSITSGYGLDAGEKNFAQQAAEGTEYVLTNLGISGETSDTLKARLDSSDYQEAVKAADVISITVGGNDLMGALYSFLASEYNTQNGTSISVEEVQLALTGQHPTINQTTFLTFAVGKIGSFSGDAAVLAFSGNLNGVLQKIRSINAYAPIILIEQYNPYTYAADNVDPSNFAMRYAAQQIKTAFDNGVDAINVVLEMMARNFYSVQVAEVAGTFADSAENPCNASFSPELNFDFHPNAYGHSIIAEEVRGMLPEIASITVPISVETKLGGELEPQEETFTFGITLPEGNEEFSGSLDHMILEDNTITVNGTESGETFMRVTGPKYAFRVFHDQEDLEGFIVFEENSGSDNWTYSDEEYVGQIIFVDGFNFNFARFYKFDVEWQPVDVCSFTNTYTDNMKDYTLTFETSGGTKVDSVTVQEGTQIDLSQYTSTKEGYDFTGWYTDAELTTKVASVNMDADRTVYAGWKEKAAAETTKTDADSDTKTPQTGDSSHMMLWFMLLMVSGTGAGSVCVYNRKKKYN